MGDKWFVSIRRCKAGTYDSRSNDFDSYYVRLSVVRAHLQLSWGAWGDNRF